MVDEKCRYGIEFNKCPHAIGIVVDGIKWDEDGTEHPYREWKPVCGNVDDACPITRSRDSHGE